MLGTHLFLAVKWPVNLSHNVDDGVDTLHLQYLGARTQPMTASE